MTYSTIDLLISTWANKHNLHIGTSFKDEEVRSVEILGPDGRKCQLWIDMPDTHGNVQVHLWDYKKRKEDYNASLNSLAGRLEEAYGNAMKWLGTVTPRG